MYAVARRLQRRVGGLGDRRGCPAFPVPTAATRAGSALVARCRPARKTLREGSRDGTRQRRGARVAPPCSARPPLDSAANPQAGPQTLRMPWCRTRPLPPTPGLGSWCQGRDVGLSRARENQHGQVHTTRPAVIRVGGHHDSPASLRLFAPYPPARPGSLGGTGHSTPPVWASRALGPETSGRGGAVQDLGLSAMLYFFSGPRQATTLRAATQR